MKYRQHKEVRQVSNEKQKEELLAIYGGREHLENPDKQLLGSQTENFVVYAPDGSVVRGTKDKMAIPRSKYEEDVYVNNHTSVWGSFWENGQWGYACCHSTIKNSYCVGKAGIQVKEQMMEDMKNRTAQKAANDKQKEEEEKEEETKKDKKKSKHEKEEKKKGEHEERDERKRGYNKFDDASFKVDDEDMEKYLAKKKRFDDPMANYVDDEDDK